MIRDSVLTHSIHLLKRVPVGVSYVTTDKKSVDDIIVIRSWPGGNDSMKTPTQIAYAEENRHLDIPLSEDVWGYKVKPNMVSCSWTKLLLDNHTPTTQNDDPSLIGRMNNAIYRLPPNKNAQIVCEDFLRMIYRHTEAVLIKSLGTKTFEMTPMDCWLTVPAIWSDSAQALTRSAAQAAGFGSREMDSLRVIAEPEAAAIATFAKYLQPEVINPPKVSFHDLRPSMESSGLLIICSLAKWY